MIEIKTGAAWYRPYITNGHIVNSITFYTKSGATYKNDRGWLENNQGDIKEIKLEKPTEITQHTKAVNLEKRMSKGGVFVVGTKDEFTNEKLWDLFIEIDGEEVVLGDIKNYTRLYSNACHNYSTTAHSLRDIEIKLGEVETVFTENVERIDIAPYTTDFANKVRATMENLAKQSVYVNEHELAIIMNVFELVKKDKTADQLAIEQYKKDHPNETIEVF